MVVTGIYETRPNVYGIQLGVDRVTANLGACPKQPDALMLDGRPAGELGEIVMEELKESRRFLEGRQRELADAVLAHFGFVQASQTKPKYTIAQKKYLEQTFTDWNGSLDRRQREALNKFGLVYEPSGRSPHGKIWTKDGKRCISVSGTLGDVNAGKQIARDIYNKLLNPSDNIN